MFPRGIPTYGPKGILFRSRIEAQWAWLFELLGWRWEYEPFDLDGYIPDFMLYFGCGHETIDVLAEIKSDSDVWKMTDDHGHIQKIKNSGWEGRWVIFGCNYLKEADDNIILGITNRNEQFCLHKIHNWLVETREKTKGTTNKIYPSPKAINTEFEALWAEAKHKAQWKAPQPPPKLVSYRLQSTAPKENKVITVPEEKKVDAKQVIATVSHVVEDTLMENTIIFARYLRYIRTNYKRTEVSVDEFYIMYLQWCDKNNVNKPETKIAFNKKVEAQFDKIQKGRTKTNYWLLKWIKM